MNLRSAMTRTIREWLRVLACLINWLVANVDHGPHSWPIAIECAICGR